MVWICGERSHVELDMANICVVHEGSGLMNISRLIVEREKCTHTHPVTNNRIDKKKCVVNSNSRDSTFHLTRLSQPRRWIPLIIENDLRST